LYPDKSLASEDTNPISSAAVPCRQMFWGLGGIRAGWRLIIYVLMVVVFSLLLQKGILKIPALAAIVRLASHGTLSPRAQFLIEGVGIISAFFAAWIMSRIEKRRLAVYGIPLKGAFGKTFWLGVIIGLLFETTEMLVIAGMGGFSFGTLSLAGIAIVKLPCSGPWALPCRSLRGVPISRLRSIHTK